MNSSSPLGTGRVALRDVVRRFDDSVVLDGFTLTLPPLTTTALMGPNGSGKTTVARLLLGLDPPDAGTVDGPMGMRRSAVFQDDRLCGQLSAVGNVRMVLDRAHWATATSDLERLGLHGVHLTTPVRGLSGGQRRRVAIVRALSAPGDLVVLDEPFTGLDVEGKQTALDYVRERVADRIALVITHDRSDAHALGARIVRLP